MEQISKTKSLESTLTARSRVWLRFATCMSCHRIPDVNNHKENLLDTILFRGSLKRFLGFLIFVYAFFVQLPCPLRTASACLLVRCKNIVDSIHRSCPCERDILPFVLGYVQLDQGFADLERTVVTLRSRNIYQSGSVVPVLHESKFVSRSSLQRRVLALLFYISAYLELFQRKLNWWEHQLAESTCLFQQNEQKNGLNPQLHALISPYRER